MMMCKGEMELKDTVDMMISYDYRKRFQAEYYQLKIRASGLEKMLKKHDEGELEFMLSNPASVYREQLHVMKLYMDILEQRAKNEDVFLDK